MIDRSKIPEIKSVETLKLHTPIRYRLANDIPVYEINLGNQSVIKLELIFHAGRWHEKEQLIAKATAQLLKTGTLNKNSEQIADFFEYYGAILAIYDGFNTVNIQLQCLSKHLKTLLPMLKEILCEPAFSEIELTKFIKLNQQNLKVQLTKNDIVAYRLFTEKIFGHNHPYGYNSTIASYTSITRDKIITHFKENYTANNCTIIISGKIPENAINLLNAHFGELPIKPKQNVFNPQMPKLEANLSLKEIVSHDSLQASIRIGRRTFNGGHHDYNAFYMTNMVLGGYFGARLMQNLRERNGFTYGVYSSMETMINSGYWYIHTDVGIDVKNSAIAEIYMVVSANESSFAPNSVCSFNNRAVSPSRISVTKQIESKTT